jgi:hypothetical protein
LVIARNEELLLPFAQFPWFRHATIAQINTIEWPTPDHLYWPELDIDLSVASIRHPESFPLIAEGGAESFQRSAAESRILPDLG